MWQVDPSARILPVNPLRFQPHCRNFASEPERLGRIEHQLLDVRGQSRCVRLPCEHVPGPQHAPTAGQEGCRRPGRLALQVKRPSACRITTERRIGMASFRNVGRVPLRGPRRSAAHCRRLYPGRCQIRALRDGGRANRANRSELLLHDACWMWYIWTVSDIKCWSIR